MAIPTCNGQQRYAKCCAADQIETETKQINIYLKSSPSSFPRLRSPQIKRNESDKIDVVGWLIGLIRGWAAGDGTIWELLLGRGKATLI